ncbi:MAG TPA: LLM class flavin-dependent oxidoreductase [Reyranella sp.]|nr:LLM class flavin-dependent oxidoreductase [Reyranella sp.]
MTQMHLGVFTYPGGHHIAGWRHGSVEPRAILGYDYYRRTAQAAERGKFDLVFVGDMLAAREKDGRVIAQGALNNIDSISILSAVAGATERVGLVATLSTTYNEPFAIAERFASLDHLSAGRAGWNIITTANDDAALNFSRKSHMEKTLRYQRAKEFVDICKSLWVGWEDGAIVADRVSGTFVDARKVHELDHNGQFFSVKGALELPRPPQGWPVMVQAGGSPAGLEFAATVGEVIFAAQSNREQAIRFRAAVKHRMPGHGRDPALLKVLPGLLPILGSTEKEALDKEKMLNELLHPAVGIWMLSEQMDFRLYDYPQEGPLPTPDIRASGGAFTPRVEHLMERADREGLSIRECGVLVAASRSHGSFVGTPEALVDHMKLWLDEGACDGFNIMPAWFHDEMDLFVDQVVPILQRRGLFRRDYEGTMLRHHLGLPIPAASAGRLAAA